MHARTMLLWCGLACGASGAAAQPAAVPIRAASHEALCAGLLEARRTAEAQGRLDFAAGVETAADGSLIARVRMGEPYSVGRIHFTGHRGVNDSTLRRALTLRERELFDVGALRRSLVRINDINIAEPLSLADVVITTHPDATADVTIPLGERRRRWWSLSGPIIPGLGSYHASISSRLPAGMAGWGRGIADASTYLVTVNLLGVARPLLRALPFVSKAPPAVVALERPYLPGHALLSGFAVSPQLSPRATIAQYGRTQASRWIHDALHRVGPDALAVSVTGRGGAPADLLVCHPPKPRLWWLRRAAIVAADLALAAVWP